MKTYLKDMLKRLNAKKENLLKRSDASEDVAEVKAISKEIDEVNAEIKEAEAVVTKYEKLVKNTSSGVFFTGVEAVGG